MGTKVQILTYKKSSPTVSETELRNQIVKDLNLDISDKNGWQYAMLDCIMYGIQQGFMEHAPLVEKYKQFFCSNCGKAHDQQKCILRW